MAERQATKRKHSTHSSVHDLSTSVKKHVEQSVETLCEPSTSLKHFIRLTGPVEKHDDVLLKSGLVQEVGLATNLPRLIKIVNLEPTKRGHEQPIAFTV